MPQDNEEYYGIVDLPLNPSTVSLGTVSVPENICLETLVFGPNSSVFLGSMEFTILLDGEPIWEGRISEVGKQIGIPNEHSYSEKPRMLMIVANPMDYLFDDLDMETTTILVAIKGAVGQCAITVDVPTHPEDIEDSDTEGGFGFDANFQSSWV